MGNCLGKNGASEAEMREIQNSVNGRLKGHDEQVRWLELAGAIADCADCADRRARVYRRHRRMCARRSSG